MAELNPGFSPRNARGRPCKQEPNCIFAFLLFCAECSRRSLSPAGNLSGLVRSRSTRKSGTVKTLEIRHLRHIPNLRIVSQEIRRGNRVADFKSFYDS